MGRAALLVPLPTATDDHQRRNAEALVRAGAAEMLEQRDLTGATLAARILALLDDEARRAALASRGEDVRAARRRVGDRRSGGRAGGDGAQGRIARSAGAQRPPGHHRREAQRQWTSVERERSRSR